MWNGAKGGYLPGNRRCPQGWQQPRRDIDDKKVLDDGLTHAAQMVEHYDIAQYATLASWARQMDREDCGRLLHQTPEEEKGTDEKLTRLVKARLNRRAGSQIA